MSDTDKLGKIIRTILFYYKIRGSDIGFSVQKMYLVLSVTSALSWLKQCICLGATHAMIFLVQNSP